MFIFAVTFGAAVALIAALGSLRAAELASGHRFFFERIRVAADGIVERAARRIFNRTVAIEHRVVAYFRASPHHAADFAAAALRFVATRSLRLLRVLHERRQPKGTSRGSVSFFVSALGDSERPVGRTTDR